MAYSKDVVDLIEDLRNRTTSNITSIHTGLVPEFLNTRWSIVNHYFYDGIRYNNYDQDMTFFKLNNIRYKIDNGRRSQSMFVENALTAATTSAKIHPFLLFINGQFVKWSKITVVREMKYSYFLVKDTKKFGKIDDVQIIHIPFNVHYTEERKFNQNDVQLFRFNEEGLIAPYGKTLFTVSNPELKFITDTHLEGAVVENQSINLDKHYKLDKNNFFVFKNKKLCRDLPIKVYNLNVLTLNDGKPLDGEYTYRIFYRTVVNENISNIIVPDNTAYLKQIITKQISAGNIEIDRLESGFDFAFSKDVSYEENLINANKYIHLYRQFLTNPVYESRSFVRTLSYTGKEIKEKLDAKRNLRMLRWKYKERDTFVMVFKNNLLHERYRDISYEANSWTMPILEEINDNDIYEIVFFLYANNTIIKQTMKADDNWITHCPFRANELQITSPFIPDQYYGLSPNDRTQYKIDFTYEEHDDSTITINLTDKSYYVAPDNNTLRPNTEVTITPDIDPNVKVTIDGEELIEAINVERDRLLNIKATHNDTTEYTNMKIEVSPFALEYLGKDIYLSSLNQFRYVYYNVQEKSCMFRMSKDFMTCLDPDRYMVFINGRMITNTMFKLLIESKNNAFLDPCIHTRVMCNPGDRVEIFYLPYDCKSVDIGNNNQTDIIKVKATTDKQPVFTIPWPFDNFLYGKNSFMIIAGTVIIDPARYNVIGNKLIFIDPDDYIDKDRELTFIFFYSKASTMDELSFVKEEDHIILDTQYVIATEPNQTRFQIPWPEGVNFEHVSDNFFVTYRSLYVNDSRYTIENGDTLVIKYTQDAIEYGSALVFTFFYPQNNSKVNIKTTHVPAVYEGQLSFDIPIPIDEWFANNNKFFVTLNGTYLTLNKDYLIDKNTVVLTLATNEGLHIGEELIYTFSYGEKLSTKATTVEIVATAENQKKFKLPTVFESYKKPGNKFFLIINTTFIDPRRYEIDDGYLIFTNDFDAQPIGSILSFLIIYTEDITYVNASNMDFSAANKYTKLESIPVKVTEENQKRFIIPKDDVVIFNKQFFITIGSTFISDSEYTKNPLTNSITFNDDFESPEVGREVLFTFIENDYLVVEHEFSEVYAEADGQTVFDIPLPFDNYFENGNKVLVFNGRNFMDSTRYAIDEEKGTVTLNKMEDGLKKNRKLVFMFLYIANQQNISYSRDDVSAVKIQEYGYIYLSKSSLKYALDKKLYFLFINGKKVDLDSIIDVAANIIRLKRDLQSRYNVCIIDYTPQIEEFAIFNKILSEYDQILNKLEYDQLNKLFNIYTKTSDTENRIQPNISQEAIINDIIRYHYVAQGISEALPFIYTYDHNTLRVIDEYGNFVSNAMDANESVNPDSVHHIN